MKLVETELKSNNITFVMKNIDSLTVIPVFKWKYTRNRRSLQQNINVECPNKFNARMTQESVDHNLEVVCKTCPRETYSLEAGQLKKINPIYR